MKKNIFKFILLFAASMFALVSCQQKTGGPDDGPDDGSDEPTVTDIQYVFSSVEGESVELPHKFENNWMIVKCPDWLQVSPKSGFAGDVNLKFTSLKSNDSFHEIEDKLGIQDGEKISTYVAIMKGLQGIASINSRYTFKSQVESSLPIEIEGTLPFEVTSAPSWLEIVKESATDSLILSDKKTKSQYVVTTLKATVKESSEDFREDKIVLEATNGYKIEIPVAQMSSEAPFKRNIFFRFTATWCGYCPIMASAMHRAIDEDPERYAIVNFYGNSEGGLTFPDMAAISKQYGVTGYPSGVFNNYVDCVNIKEDRQVELYTELKNEAIETQELWAISNIGGSLTVADGNVNASIKIKSNEAKKFRVMAFLVESGCVQAQSNASSDYVHDNVAKIALTENVMGDDYIFTANEEKVLEFSAAIPTTVRKNDNLSVVVVVLREGTFSGDVKGAGYANFFGYIEDNCRTIKVGEDLDYQME